MKIRTAVISGLAAVALIGGGTVAAIAANQQPIYDEIVTPTPTPPAAVETTPEPTPSGPTLTADQQFLVTYWAGRTDRTESEIVDLFDAACANLAAGIDEFTSFPEQPEVPNGDFAVDARHTYCPAG